MVNFGRFRPIMSFLDNILLIFVIFSRFYQFRSILVYFSSNFKLAYIVHFHNRIANLHTDVFRNLFHLLVQDNQNLHHISRTPENIGDYFHTEIRWVYTKRLALNDNSIHPNHRYNLLLGRIAIFWQCIDRSSNEIDLQHMWNECNFRQNRQGNLCQNRISIFRARISIRQRT